jgi:hypothetical protein
VLSYGITVHLHSIEFTSHSKSATLCLNYSSCSTCCTGTRVSQRYRRANRLGYSVRSTGPTETVLGNSIKRPEVLLNQDFQQRSEHSSLPSQYLSKLGQYPIPSPFKGPTTVSKAWVVIVMIMAEVPLAVAMTTVVAEATKAAPIGAIATATAPVCLPRRHHWNSCLPSRLMARCRLHSHQ